MEVKKTEIKRHEKRAMLKLSRGTKTTKVMAELKERTHKLRTDVVFERERWEGDLRLQLKGPAVRGENVLHRKKLQNSCLSLHLNAHRRRNRGMRREGRSTRPAQTTKGTYHSGGTVLQK